MLPFFPQRARFSSDPYAQQLNHFPVTLQETKHYFAMNRIGSHDVWCKHDCGIFTLKYMEIFTPRTHMANLFSNVDIPNLRIKYANDMFFSPLNICEKYFVNDFFGDGGNAK